MPWSLVSKSEAVARAGGARGKEAAMAVDAASAAVKVARRISINSSGSRNISRSNSSVSRGTSESSPRNSSGSSNISRSNSSISRDICDSNLYSTRGDGFHHALVSGVVSPDVSRPSSMQYLLHLTRVFRTRTRARKLLLIQNILETTPIWGADLLHHHSQSPSRRTCMDRLFRPSHPGALPWTGPPYSNLRHQTSRVYRLQVL